MSTIRDCLSHICHSKDAKFYLDIKEKQTYRHPITGKIKIHFGNPREIWTHEDGTPVLVKESPEVLAHFKKAPWEFLEESEDAPIRVDQMGRAHLTEDELLNMVGDMENFKIRFWGSANDCEVMIV